MADELLPVREIDDKQREMLALDQVSSVNEFLADVVDLAKDKPWTEALSVAIPWLEPLGEALSEAVPLVRFFVKFVDGLTKVRDPDALTYLACRMAYQAALREVAAKRLERPAKIDVHVGSRLRGSTPDQIYEFRTFGYDNATQHPFITDAELALTAFADGISLDEDAKRNLVLATREAFVPQLRRLLNHPKTRERFAAVRDRLNDGSDEARARDELDQHLEYTRWAFEEQPLLDESFPLARVYIDTDCGRLSWGQLEERRKHRQGERLDPFKHGDRTPLIETVLDLLVDPNFRDAIVIQGGPGSGKSSFTLRLAWELRQLGLRPIRIELKDLDTSASISIDEALPAAVRIGEGERARSDLFRGGRVFDEWIEFGHGKICPFVLILDGWDEINTTASLGYYQQVERMLDQLRRNYLERGSKVPVILCGRPTEAIERSKFMRANTVLLTVRPLTPNQLLEFSLGLLGTVRDDPRWAGLAHRIDDVLEQYNDEGDSTLSVLGTPLLAHLALRLLAQWPGTPAQLLDNPCNLYRSLIDLVIAKGGKPEASDFDTGGRVMMTGSELREYLRRTAEAMTVLGKENLSYEELVPRLELDGETLERQAQELTDDHPLSRLMISFFFKGGRRDLGCEFTHKSFREYLFAEQIVEVLKEYGRQTKCALRPCDIYWKDFPLDDSRYGLSRRMLHLLGPQWLTHELAGHVEALLDWELARAWDRNELPSVGEPTDPLDRDGWCRVRDALADLWGWWGDGVHLRPQIQNLPKEFARPQGWGIVDPAALDVMRSLVQHPLHPNSFNPVRTTTIDGHLGDGLALLSAKIHAGIAGNEGLFHELAAGGWEAMTASPGSREYQVKCKTQHKEVEWVVFKPSGSFGYYFNNYVRRIGAAGYRPRDFFPAHSYFVACWFHSVIFSGCTFESSDFSYSNLGEAYIEFCYLAGCKFVHANLGTARIHSCDYTDALGLEHPPGEGPLVSPE